MRRKLPVLTMGGGAFRDAGAALERAAALEEDNRSLNEEVVALRAEVDALKAPDNAEAYFARVQQERDELVREVKLLREAMGVVAPGKVGPTPMSRLRAQLVAERAENSDRRSEHSAQIAALTKERDQARSELAQRRTQITALEQRMSEAIKERDQARSELVHQRTHVAALEQRMNAALEPPPDERHASIAGLSPGESINRDAYVQRLQEERDELLAEVRLLRARRR